MAKLLKRSDQVKVVGKPYQAKPKCIACGGKGVNSRGDKACVPCKGTGMKLGVSARATANTVTNEACEGAGLSQQATKAVMKVVQGKDKKVPVEISKEQFESLSQDDQIALCFGPTKVVQPKSKVLVRTKEQQKQYEAKKKAALPIPKIDVETPKSKVALRKPLPQKVVNKVFVKEYQNEPFNIIGTETGRYSSDKPNFEEKAKGKVKLHTATHIIVDALAGTGKTFTIVEGVKRIMGQPTKGVVGTDQQEAIWKEMRNGARPTTILVAAFSKDIANVLKPQLPAGSYPGAINAMTLHGYGKSLISKYGQRHKVAEDKWNNYKVQEALVELMGQSIQQTKADMKRFVPTVEDLVKFCKIGLLKGTEAEVRDLIAYHAMEIKPDYIPLLVEYVPQLMEASKKRQDVIDFADMLWFPLVHGYDIKRVDFMLVDERQDMNKAQQELAVKSSRRLMLVGDTHQAVFGFAGADAKAGINMTNRLNAMSLGCTTFPLTRTRRCCKAVVRLVNERFPDIPLEAMNEAPEGGVNLYGKEESFKADLLADDMVICRTNAPLVKHAMSLLKKRIKVKIKGKDIGKDLLDIIDEQDANNVPDLVAELENYFGKRRKNVMNRRNAEAQLIKLDDDYDVLMCFTMGANTIQEVKDTISDLFTDSTEKGAIMFSSIHKAKGLEADRIFFLQWDLCPHKLARTEDQLEQEQNLIYVAMTRAELYLEMVKSEPKKKGLVDDEA